MVSPVASNKTEHSSASPAFPLLEQLEPRILLSASPSNFEQEMLWLINDMRTDPADHLDHFITGYGTPASSSDAEIQGALTYFNVVGATLQSDWSALTPAAPVAWSSLLDDAAEFHSQNMIDEDDQEHEFPPGPGLGERVDATGYVWTNLAENIFAYTESALHGHAGFVVDWGNGIDGMQNPPGHRNNIMSPLWVDVGIAAIAESDVNTEVGPYVVTQDFGKSWPVDDPYLVGTIWADANADGKFDGGEGFGGVSVQAVGAATYSTTSWGSGGYQLQLPAGTYDVSISGGAFEGVYSSQVTIAGENVKLDATPQGAEVVARHVFYNNSVLDGNDPAAGPADDNAIDASKQALLLGETVSSQNYTSYSRGINGIMIDVAGLGGAPTPADFTIRVNNGDPGAWSDGPAGMGISVRPVDGLDRVTLTWPDNAIQNQWVEVTVHPSANTGLASDDVFYFANHVGDFDGNGQVDSGDLGTLISQFGQSGVGLDADLNGDHRADLVDFAIMRSNFGNTLPPASPVGQTTHFAVIGDYGLGSTDEADVADLVTSLNPDFVVTTGDNRYGWNTFDGVVGQYYCSFLTDAGSGPFCSGGDSPTNAFFPSIGNHDYNDGGGIAEYLDYFAIPGAGVESTHTSGSERYYDFVQGPVHFFVLDSQAALVFPDEMIAQQDWLQAQMAISTAPWQIVYMHHPPYSSGYLHGSSIDMQWPYAAWGADFVISGHDHSYERIEADGIVYFVNGLGGSSRYFFATPVGGSQVRYSDDFGAMLVDASPSSINFRFINRSGLVIDDYTHNEQPANLAVSSGMAAEKDPAGPTGRTSSPVSPAPVESITAVVLMAPSIVYHPLDVLDVNYAKSTNHAPIAVAATAPTVELLAESLSLAGYIPEVQPISPGLPATALQRASGAAYDLRPLSDNPPTAGQSDDLLADILAEARLAVPL
jgi:uncharacterized protein YkwD